MSIFDRLRKKNSLGSSKATDLQSECKDSIQTAAVAMSIVEAGIESKNMSELSERLESLPTVEDDQDVYVFKTESKHMHILAMSFGLAFSLIFGVLLFLGLNTVILTDVFESLASGMVLVSFIAIVGNISVVVVEISKLRYDLRYSSYYNHLRYHRIEAVDDISEITGYRKSLVVKDLKKAVHRSYIPEGHLGRNNFLFMVSDKIFDGYQLKPAVYEHYFMEKIEERERMRGHNLDTKRILETGRTYIEKIHDSNDLIKDKVVTEKLTRMEKTVSMIFKEVDLHPQQSEKLGLFLNYYLPTTDKLLRNYISIDEQNAESKSLSKTLHELSKSLDTINTSFEKILEMLYKEQEADILSDIETMEAMMTSEGLVTPE